MKKWKKTLIYGSGAGGQLVRHEIEGNRKLGLALAGFIDVDMGKQDRRFLGYPVFGGKDSLREVVNKQKISEVIVSFREIDKDVMNSLKKDCGALGVNLSQLHISIE